MTFYIVKEIGKCEFEEYSKEKKRMVNCNCETRVKRGKQFVCKDHLPFALAGCIDPKYIDENNREMNWNKYKFKKIVESLQ